MAVGYVCDSCGFRGVDPDATTADQVLCEMCGEPVLEDPTGSAGGSAGPPPPPPG